MEEFSKTLPVPGSGIASLHQTSFGASGAIEFDLSSLKTALQQMNLNPSAVRATVRLTPIRSLNLFDFLITSPTQLSTTTQVALLDMAQNQKDLVVDYADFPGFTSPRVSNLDELAATVITAPAGRRATVRTDLLGLLAPVSFDVTEAVQRDVQSTNASTGFQVVSELNGTGLVFADSSNIIPGVSDTIAPQLVIELVGLTPPNQARFVASATRIPFDTVAQGFTDMMLVTINNVGASAGTISLDLTSGANVFGLVTADGRALSNQSNTAAIAAGDRLTFGVTFKPTDGDSFQGELQVTDTTGGKRDLVGKIPLTGATLPASFSQNLPKITAPIKPQRLPDHAARVGDLNGDGLIDAADIGQLAAIVAGSVSAPSPGTAAFAVADINGDGMIDRADLSILGDAVARNRDALPRLRPAASEIPYASRTRRAPSPASAPGNDSTGRARTGVAVMPRVGR